MVKRCSILGCEGATVGRSFCRKHYSRWWKHGTTDDPPLVAKQTCSISGCERPVKAHGWCQTHYCRWQRHGDPEVRIRIRNAGTPEERWWARVDKAGPGGCWLWTGALYWTGYGQFAEAMGRAASAHRWGYERFVGPIPRGKELDHLCRNRSCVRFDHLEPVTHRENVQRGRATKWQWQGSSCVIDDCDAPAIARALCRTHYMRQWRASRK